jgi:tetratricopeptide (TPR) repeat protein
MSLITQEMVDAMYGLNPIDVDTPPPAVPPARACENFAGAGRRAWLAVEIILRGPAFWERIASCLTAEQGTVLNQELEAFLDQLVLAGFDDENAEARAAVLAALRVRRVSGSNAADDRQTPLGRLLELRSFDGCGLMDHALAFFEFRALHALTSANGRDLDRRIALTCRNLESLAALLPQHETAWSALLDAPEQPGASVLPKRDDVEFQLQRGIERMENADFKQAIVHFTSGLKIDSKRAELYARRADAYRLQGEPRRALSDYQVAVHLTPSAIAPLLGRALVYQQIGDFERARADAAAVLAISERQPLAFQIRATAALHLHDVDAALDDFTAAIELDSDSVESLQQRGQILIDIDDSEAAIQDFNRVLKLNPQHVGALLHRGHAHRRLGDHQLAIRDYTDVLRLAPGNALALTCRGLAHEYLGDRAEALADHTEALRLDPGNVSIFLNRAKLCRVTGDLTRAHADLDDILQREPGHFAALYHRGKIAIQNGRWQRALVDLNGVLALNPELAIAYASRAVVHDRLGHVAQALPDAHRATELEPTSPIARLIRGLVLLHSRDDAKGVAELDEAIRLDAQLALAYQERSLARMSQGDLDGALADVSRLIALEPGNAQGYAQRSVLLHARGDIQQALVDYSRALQLDANVLLNSWNQPFADQQRDQTSVYLANAIDGLRQRRAGGAAPKPPEWTIVVETPRASSLRVAPIERPSAPVAPLRIVEETRRPSPPKPEDTESVDLEIHTDDAPAVLTTAAPPTSPPPRESQPAKAAVETMTNVRALDDTVTDLFDTKAAVETLIEADAVAADEAPAPTKAAKKAKRTALATPAALKTKKAEPREITPTAPGDLIPLDDPADFAASDDLNIQTLLDSVPAPKAEPEPKPLAFVPASPPSASSRAAIDCPLCRHRLPPAEVLSGGRFRCGNCNAVFFPGGGASPATAAAPKPLPRPVQRPASKVEANDDDRDPTLLERWKRPKPLAITGAVALLLMYIWFPTSLFGDSTTYTVYPVKGEAMLDGKPIPNAIIRLAPVNPPSKFFPEARATAGSDGKFALASYGADDGAAPGEYKVSVIRYQPPTAKEIKDDMYKPRNQLPAKYADPATSGLTVKIVAGENPSFTLQLKR